MTRTPLPTRPAAISEPMKPPPITTTCDPSGAIFAQAAVVVEGAVPDDAFGAGDLAAASRRWRAGASPSRYSSPSSLVAVCAARSSETMRRPVTSSTPSAGSRQSFSSGAPFHRPFVSSGRLYGGWGSAPIIVIEPSESCSRMPFAAMSPVMPAPTIRYLVVFISALSSGDSIQETESSSSSARRLSCSSAHAGQPTRWARRPGTSASAGAPASSSST